MKATYSEQAVLGAFLTDPSSHWRIGQLTADHFWSAENREIFEAIRQADAKRSGIDALTIGEATGYIEACAELASWSLPCHKEQSYFDALQAAYQKRELMKIFTEGTESLNGESTADQVIDSLISRIDALALGNGRESSTFAQALQAAQREMTAHNDGSGIPTSLPFIDSNMGGLRRKRLIIMAARPAWGKTALMLQCMLSAAKAGHAVGIASLEMSEAELGMRAICNLQGMDFGRVSRGQSSAEFRMACPAHQDLPIRIDDKLSTIGEIIARAHEWKHRHNMAVLGVDYLGLIRGGEGDNLRERMGEYCKRLRRAAKELDICVVLLVQLNRNCENDKRRPIMADIKDCGDVEQDADAIIALNPISQFERGQRIMEMGYLKSRLCQPGWCPDDFQFDGRAQRFHQLLNRAAA